jgi:hypothetical protein
MGEDVSGENFSLLEGAQVSLTRFSGKRDAKN